MNRKRFFSLFAAAAAGALLPVSVAREMERLKREILSEPAAGNREEGR